VGLGAGFGLAAGLRVLFGRFGLTLDGSLVFSARTVLWSYGVGVLVTLVAAYLPAHRAARTSPVAAMRDDASAPERSLRRRTLAGAALCLVGAAALVRSSAVESSSVAASWVGGGAVALVVGTIVLSPALAVPFLRTVGALLPALWGRTGSLARENALRNPRRTAATASALMIGLALVSAFSILGTSTNAPSALDPGHRCAVDPRRTPRTVPRRLREHRRPGRAVACTPRRSAADPHRHRDDLSRPWPRHRSGPWSLSAASSPVQADDDDEPAEAA
jgi:hypothetical protein